MASEYYGVNRGQYYNQVVSGTSTNSTDMEFRWDKTKNLTRQDVINGMQQILLWTMNDATSVGGGQDFGDNNG